MKKQVCSFAVLLCIGIQMAARGAAYDGRGCLRHGSDTNADKRIALPELLRVIQFFNISGYHCDATSPDGYGAGPGSQEGCEFHSTDYINRNWRISLPELLRLIQFFNLGGYYRCAEGPDGYCAGPTPQSKPNILVLMLDTLRNDRIGATRNNIPITPFLNELAAGGLHFTNAITPSSWTRPSMASFYTGKYPNVQDDPHSVPEPQKFLIEPEVVTTAEFFASHGYENWAYQTNHNASHLFGMNQGYAPEKYRYVPGYFAYAMTQSVLDDLPTVTAPFFTLIQYIDSHSPYRPPVEYEEFFGPQPVVPDEYLLSPGVYINFLNDLYKSKMTGSTPEYPPLSQEGIQAIRYRYDAETRYMDDEIRRLIEGVRAQYPNTVVIATADHGEALLERDTLGHGHTLYEEQLHVPLIINGPGIEPQQITHRVEVQGILPSIANLYELPCDMEWQGQDLLQQPEDQPTFSFTHSFYLDINITANSVTEGTLKYIEDSRVGTQLFDLSVDSNELNNVMSARPVDVARLAGLLAEHKAKMGL